MGITRAYWYGWDNTNIGTMWSPTNGVSPAGIAYEQVYDWMNGATMAACSLNGSTNFYHAVYTCDLTRSGGYSARAVWNTNGNSTYTAPSQFTQYRDLAGNTYTIPLTHQVTIGRKPILLEDLASTSSSAIVFQTESLPATSSGPSHQVIGSSGFSNGQGTLLFSTATGNYVIYTVSVPAAGTYDVKVAVNKMYNRGKWQLSINGTNQGPAEDEDRPRPVVGCRGKRRRSESVDPGKSRGPARGHPVR